MEFEKNDVTVGAFILAAVVVFLGALVLVNRERITSKIYHLSIELTEIAGIDRGADVMYRGYRAGQVDKVTVTYEPQFRFVVRFSVKSDIRLPPGSKVFVRGKGFTGGRFLDLVAPARAGEESVPPESVLPVELEPDLMAKANDVLGEARTVVRRFQERGTAEDAIALVHDARVAVADLRKTLASASAMMEENRAVLKDTLGTTRALTAKTDDLLARRGPQLDRSIKNLDESLNHLPSILAHVEELVADLKKHPWRLIRKGGETTPALDHKHPAAPAPVQ